MSVMPFASLMHSMALEFPHLDTYFTSEAYYYMHLPNDDRRPYRKKVLKMWKEHGLYARAMELCERYKREHISFDELLALVEAVDDKASD